MTTKPPVAFGVVDLLLPNATVFYTPLFDSLHLGKVSDLFLARLREVKIDELQLRLVLSLGVTLGTKYRGQGSSLQRGSVLIECGLDEHSCIFGFSFTLAHTFDLQGEELVQRVAQQKPKDGLESALLALHRFAGPIMVKYQPHSRRLEVVVRMLLGEAAPIVGSQSEELVQFFLLSSPDAAGSSLSSPLSSSSGSGPIPPIHYVHLGDLNAQELLPESESHLESDLDLPFGSEFSSGLPLEESIEIHNDSLGMPQGVESEGLDPSAPVQKKRKSKEPEVGIVKRLKSLFNPFRKEPPKKRPAETVEPIFKQSFSTALPEEEILIKGGNEENEEVFRFQDSSTEPSVIVVKGNEKFKPLSDERIVVSGSGEGNESAEAIPITRIPPLASPQAPSREEAISANGEGSLNSDAFNRILSAAKGEVVDIIKTIAEPQARTWVADLVKNLSAEKNKLDIKLKLNSLNSRKNEMEAAKANRTLKEELGGKRFLIARLEKEIEMLKQSQNYDQKMKLEVIKQFEQKLEMKDRMLQVVKEENFKSKKKVEDLKAASLAAAYVPNLPSPAAASPVEISEEDYTKMQSKYDRLNQQAEELRQVNRQLLDRLSNAKPESALSETASATESPSNLTENLAQLQARFERVNSQSEELKKVNRQLLDKLSSKPPSNTANDETKKRLESALTAAMTAKKDLEKIKIEVAHAKREEAKLKAEVSRLKSLLAKNK